MKKILYLLPFILLTSFMQAQDNGCNCVEEDELVTNGNFSNGNNGFSSDLEFASSCSYGTYSIEHEPRDKCNSGAWIQDLWDHTSDTPDGLYMIIDGTDELPDAALERLWYQQVTVEAGRTYSFSFWLRPTVSSSANAGFRFDVAVGGNSISGTVIPLHNHDEDPNNDNDWEYHCFSWSANSSGATEIAIRQIGNFDGSQFDYGIDDISFTACEVEEPTPIECDVNIAWGFDQIPFNCSIATFNNSSAGDNNTILGFFWDFGDGTTSTEQSPTHDYAGNGNFNVCLTVFTVTDEGECCTETLCRDITIDNCNFKDCMIEIEEINILFPPTVNSCAYGLSVTANYPITGSIWTIGLNGTPIVSTSNTINFNFPSGVDWYLIDVTVFGQSGDQCCSDNLRTEVRVNCGNDDGSGSGPDFVPNGNTGDQKKNTHNKELSVVPNPAEDYVNLSFNTKFESSYDLSIFDLQGKEIYTTNGNSKDVKTSMNLNTSDFEAGTYFVKVITEGKLLSEKLIIQ